jgi:hypothetical protein
MILDYDGITPPLSKAIAALVQTTSPNKVSDLTKQACGALNLPIDNKGRKRNPIDAIAIYEWLVANKSATPIPEADLLVNDLPTVEPAPLELNITHDTTTNNDAVSSDKFISINYRHADNSRHTVQLEQFYIDALKAIGIDDVAKFVAENAGVTTVTKNVKRAIVNVLVNRATGGKK